MGENMSRAWPRFKRRTPGFTLVELLIGVALSASVIGSVAQIAVQQINLANRVYGFISTNRNFRRLSDLLKIEVGEACILSKGGTPFREATWPDNPCKPLNTFKCEAISAAKELWLLVPLQASDGSTTYNNPIKYYLNGTDLLRDGPQVGTDGLLSTTSLATTSRVITNVTTFIPTVTSDCTSVTLEVGVTYPGKAEVKRTLSFYSGSSETMN